MSFDTVDARGLTKVYGRQRALAAVDPTRRPRLSAALPGTNGAGKSRRHGGLRRRGGALLGGPAAEGRARARMRAVVPQGLEAWAPPAARGLVLARGRSAPGAAAPQPRSTEALADVYRAAVQS